MSSSLAAQAAEPFADHTQTAAGVDPPRRRGEPSPIVPGGVESEFVRKAARSLGESGLAQKYVQFAAYITKNFPDGASLGLIGIAANSQSHLALSDVVARLGIALASRGDAETLIIDANLTSASLTERIGIGPRGGLTEALNLGKTYHEHVTKLAFDGLSVMTIGRGVLTSFEGVESGLASLIETMRRRYRYVLFDLGAAADTMTRLASHVLDGVYVGIDMQSTDKLAAAVSVEELKTAGAKVLGGIICGQPDAR